MDWLGLRGFLGPRPGQMFGNCLWEGRKGFSPFDAVLEETLSKSHVPELSSLQSVIFARKKVL